MNEKKLIEKIGNLDKLYGEKFYVALDDVLDLVKQLDEPETGHADEAPRYVKNILARLRELPLHDREIWLKAIMGEFEKDFSHAKWREGYEQGKFEGMVGREKVKIPQFVADWLKENDWREETLGEQSVFDVFDNLKNDSKNGCYENVNRWIDGNGDLFARAWLDGYEIQETRYVVTDGNHLYFKKYQEDIEIVILVDEQPGTMEYVKKFNTKEEAQEAADILGWKVEEVTE